MHAAAIIRLAPMLEVSEEDLRAMLEVNIAMAFLILQKLGPLVRDGGAIVNVASAAAKLGGATESAVYAATKAALLSLTRSFAAELAPRQIRVNAICPGIIETPMQDVVLDAKVAIQAHAREARRATARGGTASARRAARGVCGADRVPRLQRGLLHDGPGNQPERRDGHLVNGDASHFDLHERVCLVTGARRGSGF